MDLIQRAWRITVDPQYTKWTAPMQLLGDAALSALVILTVPCTWPPGIELWIHNFTTISEQPNLTRTRRYQHRLDCIHATD